MPLFRPVGSHQCSAGTWAGTWKKQTLFHRKFYSSTNLIQILLLCFFSVLFQLLLLDNYMAFKEISQRLPGNHQLPHICPHVYSLGCAHVLVCNLLVVRAPCCCCVGYGSWIHSFDWALCTGTGQICWILFLLLLKKKKKKEDRKTTTYLFSSFTSLCLSFLPHSAAMNVMLFECFAFLFLSCDRQGSGSACRSVYGGFVKWEMGEAANGSDSRAVQVRNILVPFVARYWLFTHENTLSLCLYIAVKITALIFCFSI